MLKAGTISLVAPSLGMALAVSGAEKWFVLQNRRGQFREISEKTELCEAVAGSLLHPPELSSVIYFILDEKDPAAVKLWGTKEEHDAVQGTIKERFEAAQAVKKREEELAARPRIRYMEQLIQRGVPVGEPTVLVPEILLEDFLKKNPIIYPTGDRFTTRGDFYQKRERWPEMRTPQGWVRMEKDPRRKS